MTNSPAADQRFRAEYRLRSARDYQKVYQRRAVVSDALLVVFVCENTFDHPRLGLSVSRKVGGAVVRNRWKRLLREAFRLGRNELPAGIDLVVAPRPETTPELSAVMESLINLGRRAAKRLARDRI